MNKHGVVPDKPRILIAEGPWGIQEGTELYGGLGNVMGYGTVEDYDTVTHKCKWKTNWFHKTYELSNWMMKQETPFCTECNEYVPNMIQTLWTLKNMDKIQNDATYGKRLQTITFYGPSVFYLQGTTKAKI